MKVRLLSRRDVASLLDIDDCIAAVERAFGMLGRGEVPDWMDQTIRIDDPIPRPRTPSPDWMEQTMRMDYAIAPVGAAPR